MYHDCNHINPHGGMRMRMNLHIHLCGFFHLKQFLGGNGILRRAIQRILPCFHLHKDNRISFLSNDIYFTVACAKIAFENTEMMGRKIRKSEGFSEGAGVTF